MFLGKEAPSFRNKIDKEKVLLIPLPYHPVIPTEKLKAQKGKIGPDMFFSRIYHLFVEVLARNRSGLKLHRVGARALGILRGIQVHPAGSGLKRQKGLLLVDGVSVV